MKSINFVTSGALLLCSVLGSQLVVAETIEIPVAKQGQHLSEVKRPRKGISQQQVASEFGEPVSTFGPTGNPPITRWDYANFSVYFEYDHVIHSVLKHKAPSK
jgi:outer membrane protein assembly factor BamE (lipoprotein component of BamABCDE complex)